MKEGQEKPGVKTTEFWGKIVVQVLAIVGALNGVISPDLAALITGSIEGVYNIGRSVVKYKGGNLPELKK